MLSTTILVAVMLSSFLLGIVLWAVLLRVGLRWARVPEVTTRRIVTVTASAVAMQFLLEVPLRLVTPATLAQAIFLNLLGLVSTVLVPCVIIMQVFRTRFLRSVLAWLPTLVSSVTMALLAWFVVRPFVCESFISPTNAMAPTLLGNHWQAHCPECGQPNFCSPVDSDYGRRVRPRMICENFHVHQIPDPPPDVLAPDRFLVAKFLTPNRWDVVVFQHPGNPSTLYVMRLVGLPGETIFIDGGVVWADGRKLELPDSLRGIEYLSEIPDVPGRTWGSKDRPAVLGADEYFVLGDFSSQSMDSRMWEHGAPEHNTFAVPASHMRGVVTHIYWPPPRWRILR